MNLLQFYWKLQPHHRHLLVEVVNYYHNTQCTTSNAMFVDYDKAVDALHRYFKMGVVMHYTDYFTLEILKILGAHIPRMKTDPGKSNLLRATELAEDLIKNKSWSFRLHA